MRVRARCGKVGRGAGEGSQDTAAARVSVRRGGADTDKFDRCEDEADVKVWKGRKGRGVATEKRVTLKTAEFPKVNQKKSF